MKKRRLLSIVLSLCMVMALMPQMVFADTEQNINPTCGEIDMEAYNEAHDNWLANEPKKEDFAETYNKAYDSWQNSEPNRDDYAVYNPNYETKEEAEKQFNDDYAAWVGNMPKIRDFMTDEEILMYEENLAEWMFNEPQRENYENEEQWKTDHDTWASAQPNPESFLSEEGAAAYNAAVESAQREFGSAPDFNDPKYSYDNSAEKYAEAVEKWNSEKPEFALTNEEQANYDEAYEEWRSNEPTTDLFEANHKLTKTEAKEATAAETGNIEYWQCENCKECFADEDGKNSIKLADTVTDKLPPEIIKGKGQSITAGEKKALSFTSNAAYSDFIRVELDGETLDAEYYTAESGSIIVTLDADYVATLPVGEHTIGIVSESGTAETTFTVAKKAATGTSEDRDKDSKAAAEDSAKTGDNTNLALWIALMLLSGAGITGTALYTRRKRTNE